MTPKRSSVVLETDRLVLRRHTLGDTDALARLWADPAVVQHIAPPASAEDSWGRLLRYAGHWALFGYGYLAVVEKSSGAYLGDVGVAQFRRTGFQAPEGSAEVGWALASAVHGMGYGTEAATALHGWIDAEVPVARTHCIIDPANTGSVAIAKRLGYEEQGTVTYRGSAVLLLVRDRSHAPQRIDQACSRR